MFALCEVIDLHTIPLSIIKLETLVWVIADVKYSLLPDVFANKSLGFLKKLSISSKK